MGTHFSHGLTVIQHIAISIAFFIPLDAHISTVSERRHGKAANNSREKGISVVMVGMHI